MANRLLDLVFLMRDKRLCRIQCLPNFVPDFIAHHLLTHLKQCHILFQTRNI
ncbi:hypothetical protein D3C78_1705270 [compost metagenome]